MCVHKREGEGKIKGVEVNFTMRLLCLGKKNNTDEENSLLYLPFFPLQSSSDIILSI